MYKRFNFTGKRKLSWKGNDRDLYIQLDQLEGGEYKLNILFNLDRFLKNNGEDNVYVVAYIGNFSVLNSFGKVKEVNNQEKQINIEGLTPISLIKLRILIINPEKNTVSIYADRVKPDEVVLDKKEKKKSEKLNSSLFNFKNSPLDVPYVVKVLPGERPQVICNTKIGFKDKLISNTYLQSVVMPSIFREVLMKYLIDEDLENDEWFKNIISFAENISEEKLEKNNNDNYNKNSDTLDWIDNVVERFSNHQKYIDVFNGYHEE